jgi:hypothetical protein
MSVATDDTIDARTPLPPADDDAPAPGTVPVVFVAVVDERVLAEEFRWRCPLNVFYPPVE